VQQGTLDDIVVIGQRGADPLVWGRRPTKGSCVQAESHQWAWDNRASNSGHHESGWDDGGNACEGRNSGHVPAWCRTNAGSTLPGMGWVSSPIPGDTNTTRSNDPRTTMNAQASQYQGFARTAGFVTPGQGLVAQAYQAHGMGGLPGAGALGLVGGAQTP
jgi:hypothetical protein